MVKIVYIYWMNRGNIIIMEIVLEGNLGNLLIFFFGSVKRIR